MPKQRTACNKGRLAGQKPPLKPKEIWSLRIRLQLAQKVRDLALLNLAIDSKLRGCDLISPRVRDVHQGTAVLSRTIGMQYLGIEADGALEIFEQTVILAVLGQDRADPDTGVKCRLCRQHVRWTQQNAVRIWD